MRNWNYNCITGNRKKIMDKGNYNLICQKKYKERIQEN